MNSDHASMNWTDGDVSQPEIAILKGSCSYMKRHDQLRNLVVQTRPYWDRDETRPAVRSAFGKVSQCRTLELGVFASGNEEQIFCHTCKSRPCSSCGYRATVQWQRERWAALPDVPYKGITFTMPDVLWPLFGDNPHLTTALSL